MDFSSAERTIRLIGQEAFEKLENAHVLVVGIGGVGSYAVEALARAGIGAFTLVDYDEISASNINRQLLALTSTVGRRKVDVMKERVLDINPEASVNTHYIKYSAQTADSLDLSSFDFVVDAIDVVSAKIELVVRAIKSDVPVISSMGAGNKLDPAGFRATDLFKTDKCPLARIMRKKLRKYGVTSLPAVFSPEQPYRVEDDDDGDDTVPKPRHVIPGSISFVPSAAGLVIAGEVVRRIIGGAEK